MTDEELELFPTSESALKMLSYVTPGFYDKSYVGKWMFQVMGLEYDKALKLAEELPEQFFPETATWGLCWHEIKWGLPVQENLSYQERRQAIYEKRDYHSPMTPYIMERYLENATGFTVHIADCHDAGPLKYKPPHPNVFKAFFNGDGTLDSKKVRKLIDKLKESHTTYFVNDYSMFEIVFSEIFMVSNIGLLFKIPFWKARRFDGSELWDGSHLMDAAIEYEMRLGVKYKEGEFQIAETLDIERMTARAKVPLSEKMHIEKQTVSAKAFNWQSLFFDGSVPMDGKLLMNYCRADNKTTANIRIPVASISESYGNATCTVKRNLAYFDGSLKMNGSRLLNSLNRKEAI